jgi:hypothetical protein
MARFPRILLALFGLAAAGTSLGTVTASAQDAAPVPVADAQAFLGKWAVALDAQGQVFTMNVNIQDSEGNVAAEVTSDMAPEAVKAEKVAKAGENLVLTFSIDAQGQIVPMVMTLTPATDGLDANVDFAAGMFVTTGKGTKQP